MIHFLSLLFKLPIIRNWFHLSQTYAYAHIHYEWHHSGCGHISMALSIHYLFIGDSNFILLWIPDSLPASMCDDSMSTFMIKTSRLRQNGCHFADNAFKCILFNENIWISNIICLKFGPQGVIDNIPALVQIMAWCRPGNKPLSEPMIISLLMHLCVTWSQWVNVTLHIISMHGRYNL